MQIGGVALLFWALFAPGAPAPRLQGATEIAAYDFQPLPDRDFLKPENWTRVIRPGYPFFVDAELTDQVAVVGTRSLVFRLNGGNCAYFSPATPASSDYNYFLQGQVKTEGLVGDRAFLLLEFLDQRKRLVGKQHLSATLGGTSDWQLLTVGPVAPADPNTRFVRIACLTQHGSEMDLTGKVYFDDLWIGRLPRFELKTSGAYRIFDVNEAKHVSVRVSGVENRRIDARFYLSDENRRPITEHVQFLTSESRDIGVASWEVPIAEVGFFHLDVGLYEGNRKILERDYPITVLRPLEGNVVGTFGLSAPTPAHGLENYDRIMEFSGARFMKLPLWDAEQMSAELRGDRRPFARFLERISLRGHVIIGALDRAPPKVEDNLLRPPQGIADIFTLPTEKWAPDLEGVVALHGLKVTHWQVGADDDSSFTTLPDPGEILAEVRRQLDLIGRDTKLGLTWNWLSPPLRSTEVTFLSLTDAPPEPPPRDSRAAETWTPMSANELLEALARAKGMELGENGRSETETREPDSSRRAPLQLWVQLAPIAEHSFGRRQQLLDFTDRILAAKIGGADAIFATRITEPGRGLLAEDGSPTELYTPWRTLAEHLGDTEYLGRLYLGPNIDNHVFSRNGTATVVLRADRPTRAEIVVGSGATRTDLWGRRALLNHDEATALLDVDEWPLLVTNVSGPLMRLQLGIRFAKGKLPSEYGRQTDELLITNPFNQTLSGRVSALFPAEWRSRPESADLQIIAGQTFSVPILFDIPQGAAQGDLLIPLDFEINTDRTYRFRVYRPYRLGGDEIQVATVASVLPDGQLDIEMRLTNMTDAPMSLECGIRAYNHNVVTEYVEKLGSAESAVRRFRLSRARELEGKKILLEINEIGGRRQFTYLVNPPGSPVSENDPSAPAPFP